uniref:Pectate lyase n=1 Tax=viral metagenome TaxID=1070528 RepID=A0A6M3IFT2_9ZZZZ
MKNVHALKRGFHWSPEDQDLGIYVNGVQVASYSEKAGRDYYVNNITGASTNDGRSWGSAFDQVSTAITASEAYRAEGGGAPTVTTNDYVRNRIFVQGTGTTYTYIAALPSYCDVYGVGADPRGDGTGIVVLGDAAGSYDGAAGSMRGTNIYNIQFVGASTKYAMDLAVAYRSVIENCTFGGNASSAACAIGLNVVSGSGLTVRNCANIAHAAFPVIGFCFASAGGNFNQCLVEDNMVYGSTTGMSNAGYLSNLTLFRNNVAYGGTTGISDTSANTGDGALAFYWKNFGSGATTGMTMTNSPERHCMDNYSVSNATSAVYYALGA